MDLRSHKKDVLKTWHDLETLYCLVFVGDYQMVLNKGKGLEKVILLTTSPIFRSFLFHKTVSS